MIFKFFIGLFIQAGLTLIAIGLLAVGVLWVLRWLGLVN